MAIGVERMGDTVWICGAECTIDQAKVVRKQLVAALKEPKAKAVFSDDSIPMRLARAYYRIISARNKEIKEPDYQKWAAEIDLMLRVDKRQATVIYQKMQAVQEDTFWCDNCLAPAKLRMRWNEGKLNKLNKGNEREEFYLRYAG